MNKADKLYHFNDFLAKISLSKYREKYSKTKLVELDLPRNIQAIRLIYEVYWNSMHLIDYDEFYKKYSSTLEKELEEFRQKQMFSVETFYRGLPARIYRTWAALLTQIQGGYTANFIYPKVVMSAELDYSGIDIRIFTDYKEYINIQVKKESVSREVRSPWVLMKKGEQITNITYEVTSAEPLTKTGKECVLYKRWLNRWGDKLRILDNGFVVFLPAMFEIDNIKTP